MNNITGVLCRVRSNFKTKRNKVQWVKPVLRHVVRFRQRLPKDTSHVNILRAVPSSRGVSSIRFALVFMLLSL